MFINHQVFKQSSANFATLFNRILTLLLERGGPTLREQTLLLIFLKHLFNSLVCATRNMCPAEGSQESCWGGGRGVLKMVTSCLSDGDTANSGNVAVCRSLTLSLLLNL